MSWGSIFISPDGGRMFLSRRMDTGWVPEGALVSGRVGMSSLDMDGMCDFLWLVCFVLSRDLRKRSS